YRETRRRNGRGGTGSARPSAWVADGRCDRRRDGIARPGRGRYRGPCGTLFVPGFEAREGETNKQRGATARRGLKRTQGRREPSCLFFAGRLIFRDENRRNGQSPRTLPSSPARCRRGCSGRATCPHKPGAWLPRRLAEACGERERCCSR